MPPRILIADDEPSIRRVLAAQLAREGLQVEAVADGAAAVDVLEEAAFHCVVTDLRMPRLDGMGLLAWCAEHRPGLPVIVITAFGTVDSAVEAIKRGAFDYVTKPFDQADLQRVVLKALAHHQRNRRALRADSTGRFGMVGLTPGMREVYNLVEKVAASPATVLVQGESGTGKELVARALHAESDRRSGPFLHVNCGAIPDNLFESELFGHEKGAFTGAVGAKPGRFELADGGTLLLDEVSELPRDMQVKLLRVLQERTFERVGGIRPIHVDVRVVAATNVDLAERVAAGAFREDLFYRLNVIPIRIPPLRERLDDLPLLVAAILRRCRRLAGRPVEGVSEEALLALRSWHWPGNVRELENVLERAVLLCEGPVVGAGDLGVLAPPGASADPDELDLKEYLRVHTTRLERSRIVQALEAEDGNVTRTARRLGISRKSLQTKMKDHGLRERTRTGDGS